MAKQSAGILLYRNTQQVEVFLVHPGGPFFRKKDLGIWSVPKGEISGSETAMEAATREFEEETRMAVSGEFLALTAVRQKSGKMVHVWAVAGDINAETIVSNTFDMEWPPHSGTIKSFPENDRGGWFSIEEAKVKINERQIPLLDELVKLLS